MGPTPRQAHEINILKNSIVDRQSGQTCVFRKARAHLGSDDTPT